MSLAPAPPAARRGLLVDLPELRDRSRAFEDRADAADLLARALNFCRRLRPAVVPADADAVDLASQVAARLGAPCALPLPAPRPYRGRRLTARRSPGVRPSRRTRRLAPPVRPRHDLVIVVDEGLLRPENLVARVGLLRAAGARRVVVAAPTGTWAAAECAATAADVVLCANLRSGPPRGIAESYRRQDVVPPRLLRPSGPP